MVTACLMIVRDTYMFTGHKGYTFEVFSGPAISLRGISEHDALSDPAWEVGFAESDLVTTGPYYTSSLLHKVPAIVHLR